MSKIIFEEIRWKNLLSTGNDWTVLELNKSPSTLIYGKNGGGKSTLLDALTFSLFNKPFRNINKPELINTINDREMVVEVKFTIGRKKYKIVRGMKPNVFEIWIDGKMIDQTGARDYQEYLEKNILKMTLKAFTQIVVLGSATFVPFMQLKAADRRAIIEDLLDIKIFSAMNIVLKQRRDTIRASLDDIKKEMDIADIRIDSLKTIINEMNTNVETKVKKNKDEIKTNKAELKKLKASIENCQKKLSEFTEAIKDEKSHKVKIDELSQIGRKFQSSLSRLSKDLTFYHENCNCPTCHQDIPEEFKTKQIEEKDAKLAELQAANAKLEKSVNVIKQKLKTFEEIRANISEVNLEMVKYNTSIGAIENHITKLEEEIDSFKQNTSHIEKEQKKLEDAETSKKDLVKQQEDLVTKRHYYEVAATLLKDGGIKSKIIKQYLPIMNKTINKYLSAMDFFVNFNLDENFDEIIKSRHRDAFSYNNFSEGEKQKIDMSLMFTWRTIAKMKNSLSTNLLVLDEIFDSSMDTDGTEELMKILQTFNEDTNIFVISHKGDMLFDKFRSVIKFEKSGSGFSKMIKDDDR